MSVQAPERIVEPIDEAQAFPAFAEATVDVRRIAIACALSSVAAAWMAAGVFKGPAARGVGIFGALLGVGLVAVSYRTARPSLVQYLTIPAAMLAGALFVLPDTTKGGADLPAFIGEALHGGGLAQPPLPFDPGWRFILVVLTAMIGAGAVGIAVSLNRPKLGVAVPIPLLMAGALIQPPGSGLVSVIVAVVLALAGLSVAYGGELAAEGAARKGFELKRLAGGAAMLAALVAAIVAISSARFLFPKTSGERIVPAKRPQNAQPISDRVLFTVSAGDPGPWRLGVLDGYDGTGWLLPPYNPKALRDVRAGVVPQTFPISKEQGTIRTTFTLRALPGHVIPVPSDPLTLDGLEARTVFDPRTQVVRVPDVRLQAGTAYTVSAPVIPGGKALAAAGKPSDVVRGFLSAPPAPNEIVTLLAGAPENAWDRLQFVRARFYAKVVASGAGNPVDVPPRRVVELLHGQPGTPFEIAASEALLARWAGVPSRIGFGYYRGETVANSSAVEVHPRDGASWLEAYFEGYGWVPIVGTPPRARASLSAEEKNSLANVRATDELALIVHVPIRLRTVRLFYITVRYWLARVLPILLLLLLGWWAAPGVFKIVRRARRVRWARSHGARERLGVAYAELRDTAADLGIVEHSATPLAFLERIEHDDEHTELAWLVTRAMWGDLARDLRDEDIVAAEEMARSVRHRIARAHAPLVRLLAFGARTSLRAPYSTEIPNVWPRSLGRRAVATAMLALCACAPASGGASGKANHLPARLVPATIDGFTIKREPSAEKAYVQAGKDSLVRDGRVYTIHRGDTIEAYLQAAAFEPGLDALQYEVRQGVLASLGSGRFTLQRLGDERVYFQQLPDQRMLLSFTHDGGAMLLFVARRSFTAAEQTFLDILHYEQGRTGATAKVVPSEDPRRGGEA